MDFKNLSSYTYQDIKERVQVYENSQKILLTERTVKTIKKNSFKMICVKNSKTMCPFRISFLKTDDSTYVYQEKTSVLTHNHGKFSKNFFQKNFFKRDFSLLQEPLSRIIEKSPLALEELKPKKLLKILKEDGSLSSNISKGFRTYHKIFKKKFDNLLRKVKQGLKKKDLSQSEIVNETIAFQSSISTDETAKTPTNEFKSEENSMIEEVTNKNEDILGEIQQQQQEKNLQWDCFINDEECPKWFIPFNFY